MEERILPIENSSKAIVANAESPYALGLKLPEAFTTSYAGQDFWNLRPRTFAYPTLGTAAL